MEEVSFPNEVWLEIFKWIDLPRLMKLRLVCHKFYDLIEDRLNKSPEWRTLANEAISYEAMENTMQRANPYVLVPYCLDIHDPVLWRRTYSSFKKWQKVMVNPTTKNTIVPNSNFGNISCVRTFGKYIAIAFDNGSIANYTIDDTSQPFYLANHGTSLIQIEFWYSNGDTLVVSLSGNYALKFWDLQNKIEIATNGFFANSISFGECRHFCIGDMEGILTSYERVGNHILPGANLNFQLEVTQHFIAHTIEGVFMTALAWQQGGTVHFLYNGVIENGKLIKFIIIQETDWKGLPENLGFSIQKMYMKNLLFFIINENLIGWTSQGERTWRVYNLAKYFGCNVKSIAMHAQILMFGLEDGSIDLLYISHYGYVRNLEEWIQFSKKIHVDTEPIVHLSVLEVDKNPCIVAVTDHKVHLINFF